MTVSADQAKKSTTSANRGGINLRGGRNVRAGSYLYAGDDLVSGWHHHDLHQIEYAHEGIADVETVGARYLLPPQQAIWIPAGLDHCTTLRGVRSVAVFFSPEMLVDHDGRARVIAVSPLLREMICHTTRWPIERPRSDVGADVFFEALAALTQEAIEHEAPLSIPTSSDPFIREVMTYTQDHLDSVDLPDLCAAIGTSERTLRRRFTAETGITWGRYLLVSRLLRSMALLNQSNQTITQIALAVGFGDPSAFTRAFRRHSGETPSHYRHRGRSMPVSRRAST